MSKTGSDGGISMQEVVVGGIRPPKITVEFIRRPRPCPWCNEPIGEHPMIDAQDGRAWFFICTPAEREGVTMVIHTRMKPVELQEG